MHVRDLHLSGQKLIMEGPMQLRTREGSLQIRVVLMTNMLLLMQEREGRLLPKVALTEGRTWHSIGSRGREGARMCGARWGVSGCPY